MTADVMSGHKDVVRASSVDNQGRINVVTRRESRAADEQGRNKQSRDQEGQTKWSTADE